MFGKRNRKLFYLKAFKKIKSLLDTEKYRRILVFLFFFLISLGFWTLQTLKNDFEMELMIPIKLINVPSEVVVTAEPPAFIKIIVKDKGTMLLNYSAGEDFYPIQLNFKDYQNRGSHVKIASSELEKRIQTQLSASTKLMAIKPDIVDYIYSVGAMKRVPVQIRGKITTGSQYYVTDTIFSLDSVFVYAPQRMLDSIKSAYTQLVMLDGITETKRARAGLVAIRGAKFVPNVINLSFPVDVFTEKTLEIPLVGVHFPPNRALRAFPSKVKATFQVGLHHFKAIHPEDFIIEVPYEELLQSKTERYKLKLKSVPAGVNRVRIIPEQVDFLIEKVATNGN